MANKNLNNNAKHIEQDLNWLITILEDRLQSFTENKKHTAFEKFIAPVLKTPVSIYQQFIISFELNNAERLILLLSLLPYVAPNLIEKSLVKFNISNKQIQEIGGIKGSWHGGLIPTGETAIVYFGGG